MGGWVGGFCMYGGRTQASFLIKARNEALGRGVNAFCLSLVLSPFSFCVLLLLALLFMRLGCSLCLSSSSHVKPSSLSLPTTSFILRLAAAAALLLVLIDPSLSSLHPHLCFVRFFSLVCLSFPTTQQPSSLGSLHPHMNTYTISLFPSPLALQRDVTLTLPLMLLVGWGGRDWGVFCQPPTHPPTKTTHKARKEKKARNATALSARNKTILFLLYFLIYLVAPSPLLLLSRGGKDLSRYWTPVQVVAAAGKVNHHTIRIAKNRSVT